MIVAVTDTMGREDKFRKYIDWIGRGDASAECIRISYALDNLADLGRCGALLLTGGHDVDPRLYGGPTTHPSIVDVDRKRDDFECSALDLALSRRLPVLGICRGMQLANVHFGGTLIPDIQEAGFPSHKTNGSIECRHDVELDPASAVSGMTGVRSGSVTSSHHQAVDRIGRGLRVVARSKDGIAEAMEWNKQRPEFLLLVQWHPERMTDAGNPLAEKILQKFLASIKRTQDE